VYWVNVYWFSSAIGQQDYRDVAIHRTLSPIGWDDFQTVRQLKGKLPIHNANFLCKTPAAPIKLLFI
jgi:hypothetical protein